MHQMMVHTARICRVGNLVAHVVIKCNKRGQLELCSPYQTWTNALEPSFRPVKEPEASPSHECAEFLFTATVLLEKHGSGTKYTAIAQHRDNAAKERHEQMGFEAGWGACLDQLVAMVKTW